MLSDRDYILMVLGSFALSVTLFIMSLQRRGEEVGAVYFLYSFVFAGFGVVWLGEMIKKRRIRKGGENDI